jgi:hypothetical protein
MCPMKNWMPSSSANANNCSRSGAKCISRRGVRPVLPSPVSLSCVANFPDSENAMQESVVQPRRAEPLRSSPETPFAAPSPLFQASNRETDETYGGVVAVLNSKLRVVAGSCGLQWVIQKRKNPLMWIRLAYCGTKEGLLLRVPRDGQGSDPEAWAVIEALPEFFPKTRIS